VCCDVSGCVLCVSEVTRQWCVVTCVSEANKAAAVFVQVHIFILMEKC
jgi:hypothetical protein